jgi:hypothetical protein
MMIIKSNFLKIIQKMHGLHPAKYLNLIMGWPLPTILKLQTKCTKLRKTYTAKFASYKLEQGRVALLNRSYISSKIFNLKFIKILNIQSFKSHLHFVRGHNKS